MNGLPYYKRYPRDFFEGTIGMPLELKGPYSLIVDLIYMQNGSLPDDARYISGLLGCGIRQWASIRNKLIEMGKIQTRDGYLGNFRADKELVNSHLFQDKQRENGAKGGKNKDLAQALAKPKPSQSEPEPEEEKEDNPPPSVSMNSAREKKTAAEVYDGIFFKAVLAAVGLDSDGPLPEFWRHEKAMPFIADWRRDMTDDQIIAAARASRVGMPMPPDGPKALNRVMQVAKPPPARGDVAKYYAGLINSKNYVAPSAISTTTRAEMIQQKLVTESQLRERGIQ